MEVDRVVVEVVLLVIDVLSEVTWALSIWLMDMRISKISAAGRLRSWVYVLMVPPVDDRTPHVAWTFEYSFWRNPRFSREFSSHSLNQH